MALTENRDVDHYVDQELRSFRIAAGVHLFKGALVGLTPTGYARPLQAGDPFVGLAFEEVDNTAGADGDIESRVSTVGDFAFVLSGATVADVARPVFASADDTLTFVAGGNSYVGSVEDLVSDGNIILRLDTAAGPIKTVTHPVEDLAAGADVADRAVHAFAAPGWIVGARVVNQATAASGIDDTNTCVVTLTRAGQTVAQVTFDSTTSFPGANASQDMGTITNAHAAGADVITLAVTNGPTADPGPFLIEVDYV